MGKMKTSESNSRNNHMNHKEILKRISGFKNNLSEIAKTIGNYNTKSSEVRDKNDELAKCLIKYKKVENFETTSQYAMSIAAEILSKVGDHQTAAIKRIETKVLPNLSTYGRICKCLQSDVQDALKADRRVISKRKLAKTLTAKASKNKEPGPSGHSHNLRGVVSDAERDLENANAESSRLNHLSQEQILKFEHKRLTDLKESLESFFRIEIAKHAKSLELLTDAYKYIHSIDEDADLEVLRKRLKLNKISVTRSKGKTLKHQERDRSHKSHKSYAYEYEQRHANEHRGKRLESEEEEEKWETESEDSEMCDLRSEHGDCNIKHISSRKASNKKVPVQNRERATSDLPRDKNCVYKDESAARKNFERSISNERQKSHRHDKHYEDQTRNFIYENKAGQRPRSAGSHSQAKKVTFDDELENLRMQQESHYYYKKQNHQEANKGTRIVHGRQGLSKAFV